MFLVSIIKNGVQNTIKLSNGPSKKERGRQQRMQKGADCF